MTNPPHLDRRKRPSRTPTPLQWALAMGLGATPWLGAQAQTAPRPLSEDAWRQCAATTDNQSRLACFDT